MCDSFCFERDFNSSESLFSSRLLKLAVLRFKFTFDSVNTV